MKLRHLLALAALAATIVGTAAYAIQPGTNGTEKRFQQSGFKVGVLEQVIGTATASSGAATLNASGAGIVTSESLTTAAGADYTLTVTDSMVAASDIVTASLQNGSNTGGYPGISRVTPAAGSVVVLVHNFHASSAFNGTLKVSFKVLKNSALDAD